LGGGVTAFVTAWLWVMWESTSEFDSNECRPHLVEICLLKCS